MKSNSSHFYIHLMCVNRNKINWIDEKSNNCDYKKRFIFTKKRKIRNKLKFSTVEKISARHLYQHIKHRYFIVRNYMTR